MTAAVAIAEPRLDHANSVEDKLVFFPFLPWPWPQMVGAHLIDGDDTLWLIALVDRRRLLGSHIEACRMQRGGGERAGRRAARVSYRRSGREVLMNHVRSTSVHACCCALGCPPR